MKFWKRLFQKKEIPQEEEIVELSLDELEDKINESIKEVNDVGDENFAEPVVKSLIKVKTAIEELMSREPESEYNKALYIGANNARNRINDQLMPLLQLEKPKDLISINKFIKGVENLLGRAARISEQSAHAQVVFKSEMSNLSNAFTELNTLVEELKDAVSERNNQLNSLMEIIDNIKTLRETIRKLDETRAEEMGLRKRISSYERDKAFLSAEVSRIKGLEFYNELLNAETILKNINTAKLKLEGEGDNIASKFSKALRKEFRNNEAITEFLSNPLLSIVKNSSLIKKEIKQLLRDIKSGKLELDEQEKKKILNLLKKDPFQELVDKYKKLLAEEKEIKEKDFTLLRQATAFEKRLIEINSKINNEMKKLDAFKEKLKKSEDEVQAVKAKVEALASNYYPEKVKITLL